MICTYCFMGELSPSSLAVVLPLPKLRPWMRNLVKTEARKHGLALGCSSMVVVTPEMQGEPSAHFQWPISPSTVKLQALKSEHTWRTDLTQES